MFFRALVPLSLLVFALAPTAHADAFEDAIAVSELTTQESACIRQIDTMSVVLTAPSGKEFRISYALSRVAAAADAPPAMMLQIWVGTQSLAEAAQEKEKRNKAVLEAGGTTLEPSFDFSDTEAEGRNYAPARQTAYEQVLREILEAAASCEVTVASAG